MTTPGKNGVENRQTTCFVISEKISHVTRDLLLTATSHEVLRRLLAIILFLENITWIHFVESFRRLAVIP